MPFPDVNFDFETLFEPTRIWLFGKPFPTIVYVQNTMAGTGDVAGAGHDAAHANEFTNHSSPAGSGPKPLPMPPRRIERTLRRQSGAGIFARIYSFSYEGHYYNLPRPMLFLVTGEGHSPQKAGADGRVAFSTKMTGVEARDWNFSDEIRVWTVDKKDMTVCLDIEVGIYEHILLDSMVAFEDERAGRGPAGARGSAASRGSAAARGSASFRGSMVGPHQDR